METMEKRKIVVMGGSFNPPTVAHYRLMRTAIEALGADKGFFVPVSDAYLRRKMRHAQPPVVFSPEWRIEMLRCLCTDSRMEVCTKEMGTVAARTMPTLLGLQQDYPDAELYFLMGADKLKLLTSLTEKRGFLDAFQVVLYAREQAGIMDTLKGDSVLSSYLSRILILPQPDGTEGVSSSRIRERLLAGECCQELLCPGVWDLLKGFRPTDFPETIDSFKGVYDFLSNRFACCFIWEGLRYGNAEAAFQSSKYMNEQARKVFCNYSADKAALKGNGIPTTTAWERQRLDIMASILSAKFAQNTDLMRRLRDTGNRLLINGNNKHELFWGVDLYSWEGENNLGKLLMKIRDKEITK